MEIDGSRRKICLKQFEGDFMSGNEIDNIYEHLQDDISRNIFNARIKCASTGNIEYMTKLPMQYRSLNADIIQFRNDLYNGKNETVLYAKL
jgi:hypothetical protein